MLVTEFTSGALKCRREAKRMASDGYQRIEGDWRLQRGPYYDKKWQITDAKISHDGKYIYVKTNITTR